MLSAGLLAAAAARGPTAVASAAAAGAGVEHVEAPGGARHGAQGEGDLQEAAARRLTPREEKQLLLPLLRLRQACCHPQVRPSSIIQSGGSQCGLYQACAHAEAADLHSCSAAIAAERRWLDVPVQGLQPPASGGLLRIQHHQNAVQMVLDQRSRPSMMEMRAIA